MGTIDDKALRRILHKLRSDAHVAEAMAQRHRKNSDNIAGAYQDGEAAGLMAAVGLLEKVAAQPLSAAEARATR